MKTANIEQYSTADLVREFDRIESLDYIDPFDVSILDEIQHAASDEIQRRWMSWSSVQVSFEKMFLSGKTINDYRIEPGRNLWSKTKI